MSDRKINIINRFLFFCAGVQRDLIVQCPTTEYLKYASIGASVFFTTVLALVSSFFAFSLVFEEFSIRILFSVLWMGIIFNLDRFLVSGIRKGEKGIGVVGQYLPRIVLAFFIAMVVSKPIELKLFEQEIDKQLTVMQLMELNEIDRRWNLDIENNDQQVAQLQQQLEGKFQLKEQYYLDYKCECDGTCGTGIKGRGSECERKRIKYESFNKEYQEYKVQTEQLLGDYRNERNRLIDQKAADRNSITEAYADGLLARLEALNNLPGNYSLAIMLIFMLVEIAPIITKMMSSKGPYEMLIQQTEHQYDLNYREKIHSQNQEHFKNKKLVEIEKEYQIKLVEDNIYHKKREHLIQKHEALRGALKKKLNPRDQL
jgi:hypothetical protein